MSTLVRIASAFALSFLISGTVQQLIMARELSDTTSALLPLAIGLALMTIVFGCVLGLSRSKTAVGWTAAAVLFGMFVFAVAIYLIGLSSITPGVGGNILYGLALLVDFYFFLPAALGVPIHWLLLRTRQAAPGPYRVKRNQADSRRPASAPKC